MDSIWISEEECDCSIRERQRNPEIEIEGNAYCVTCRRKRIHHEVGADAQEPGQPLLAATIDAGTSKAVAPPEQVGTSARPEPGSGEQVTGQGVAGGSTSKFCGECGEPTVEGGHFCGNCGNPVHPNESANQVVEPISQPSKMEEAQVGKRAPRQQSDRGDEVLESQALRHADDPIPTSAAKPPPPQPSTWAQAAEARPQTSATAVPMQVSPITPASSSGVIRPPRLPVEWKTLTSWFIAVSCGVAACLVVVGVLVVRSVSSPGVDATGSGPGRASIFDDCPNLSRSAGALSRMGAGTYDPRTDRTRSCKQVAELVYQNLHADRFSSRDDLASSLNSGVASLVINELDYQTGQWMGDALLAIYDERHGSDT